MRWILSCLVEHLLMFLIVSWSLGMISETDKIITTLLTTSVSLTAPSIIQPQINIFFDQSRVTQKKKWRWCLFHHDQWTMLTSSCRYIVHKIINICSYDPCFLSESFTFNVTKKHNSRDILLLTNYSFILFQIPLFKLVLALKFRFSKHYRTF